MYYKTDYNLTFSLKKKYNIEKSLLYRRLDSSRVLQLHGLPLLPVTGEKPHTKERAKSPICQDLDGWDTGERKEKEKREVQLPMIIAAPWLQINIRPWSFWLPVRYFFIKVINMFIFLPVNTTCQTNGLF